MTAPTTTQAATPPGATLLEPDLVDRDRVAPLAPRATVSSTIEATAGGVLVRMVLHVGADPLVVDALRPWRVRLAAQGGPADQRILVSGYHSFSGSGSFDLSEVQPRVPLPFLVPTAHNTFVGRQPRGRFVSTMWSAVVPGGGDALVVGFCDPRRWCTQIVTEWRDGAIEMSAQIQTERIALEGGTSIELPPLFVADTDASRRGDAGSGAALLATGRPLDAYARALAVEIDLPPTTPVADGYCSWYRHYTRISESQLLDDLAAVHRELGDRVELFHVDDGYQSAVGDWLSFSDGFPRGLTPIVDAASEAGYATGLWVAPFFAEATSAVAREHPDWLLRDERGRPVVGMRNLLWDPLRPVRVLDVTHPEVLAHLARVFGELTSWGISLFKLDFLFAGTQAGRRHDPTVTSLEGARRAMATIRDAVGPDVVLMGCGCPVELAIGTVEATRSSCDVTPSWTAPVVSSLLGGDFELIGTKYAHSNTLVRSFTHRRWFELDPDCLMAFAPRNRLTDDEAELLAATNAVAGGPLMFATAAAELDATQVDYLRRAHDLNREVRRGADRWWSPDAVDRRHPEISVAAGDDEAWMTVAAVRSGPVVRVVDAARILGWPRGEVRVEVLRDGGATIRTAEGTVRISSLPPHACAVLRLRRSPDPDDR